MILLAAGRGRGWDTLGQNSRLTRFRVTVTENEGLSVLILLVNNDPYNTVLSLTTKSMSPPNCPRVQQWRVGRGRGSSRYVGTS